MIERALHADSSWSQAVEDLYARSAGPLVAFAYLLTADRHLAEDLVQDAFARLVGRFAHVRRHEALEAYLRRTIINLHLSRLRRLRQERALVSKSLAGGPSALPDVETTDAVLMALRRIPRRQQVAIVLRYCLDYSELSVAQVMDCSPAAARSLIGRGMQSLRRVMGGAEYGSSH